MDLDNSPYIYYSITVVYMHITRRLLLAAGCWLLLLRAWAGMHEPACMLLQQQQLLLLRACVREWLPS
jgi:hypothetical protein